MLVMTALYLLAGVMRDVGGSFSLDELGGLYRNSAVPDRLALLIFLAAAGLPPGSGLWPKVMLVKSLDRGRRRLARRRHPFSGFLTTIALGRVFLLAFWGRRKPGWIRR